MSKQLDTRILNKYDEESNWSQATFIPLKGEVLLYHQPDITQPSKFKVGDGVKTVNELKFVECGISSNNIELIEPCSYISSISTRDSDGVPAILVRWSHQGTNYAVGTSKTVVYKKQGSIPLDSHDADTVMEFDTTIDGQWLDPNVMEGQTYYYKVVASNAQGIYNNHAENVTHCTLVANYETATTPAVTGKLTYNGDNQDLLRVVTYDSEACTVNGSTSAKEAGEYTLRFTLKSGHTWEDSSFDDKSIKVTIDPCSITIQGDTVVLAPSVGNAAQTRTLECSPDINYYLTKDLRISFEDSSVIGSQIYHNIDKTYLYVSSTYIVPETYYTITQGSMIDEYIGEYTSGLPGCKLLEIRAETLCDAIKSTGSNLNKTYVRVSSDTPSDASLKVFYKEREEDTIFTQLTEANTVITNDAKIFEMDLSTVSLYSIIAINLNIDDNVNIVTQCSQLLGENLTPLNIVSKQEGWITSVSSSIEITQTEPITVYTGVDPILNNNDWIVISEVSKLGVASTIWDIGDAKQITLNGVLESSYGDGGTYTNTWDNYSTSVFIIGFDHNADIETAGQSAIHFQGFYQNFTNLPASIACSPIGGFYREISQWPASKIVTTHLPQIRELLPQTLHDVLRQFTKWTCVWSLPNSYEDVALVDNISCLSTEEIGITGHAGATAQRPYTYYAAGNQRLMSCALSSEKTDTTSSYWLRNNYIHVSGTELANVCVPEYNESTQTLYGAVAQTSATSSYPIVPIFVV